MRPLRALVPLAFALLALGACVVTPPEEPVNWCEETWDLMDRMAEECGMSNPLGSVPPPSLCTSDVDARTLCQACCFYGTGNRFSDEVPPPAYPTCDDLGDDATEAVLFCSYACYEDPAWSLCYNFDGDEFPTPCQNDMHQVLAIGWNCGVEPPVPYSLADLAECSAETEAEMACRLACVEAPPGDYCAAVRPPEGGGPSAAETCQASCRAQN